MKIKKQAMDANYILMAIFILVHLVKIKSMVEALFIGLVYVLQHRQNLQG